MSQQQESTSVFQIHQLGNKLVIQKEDHNESPIVAPLLAKFEHASCSPLLLYPEMIPEAIRIISPEETHVVDDLIPMILQSSVEQLQITQHNSKSYYWAKSLSVTSKGVVALTKDVQVSWPTKAAEINDNRSFGGSIIKVLKHRPDWIHNNSPKLDKYGLFIDIKVKGIVLKLRYIPPGSVFMGSPEDEIGRKDNELQHLVLLKEGFWLGETTITQELWQAVMNDNPSYFKDADSLPVTNVSWNSCQQFLHLLNENSNDTMFSLPSEAQWEYACRAGTQTPFSFGEFVTNEKANFYVGKGKHSNNILSVKTFEPNPWGLYQMHGNVWEWCIDTHREYESETMVDPIGSFSSSHRVFRGGSWYKSEYFCRSASRSRLGRGLDNRTVGLRLILNV